jgi:hypothetical protein
VNLATLRRISATRPSAPVGERCEMCTAPVADEHQHVVDVVSRSLMCTCRPCYLLFTDQQAALRYRAVPDRYASFPDFRLDQGDWDDLQIPVGLAFLFTNSTQQRVVAFYPSPAGATESELSLSTWERVLAANPALRTVLPDVEALLVRGGGHPTSLVDTPGHGGGFVAHLVPIDACYELVGGMRATWRGFDGGQEARAALAEFFDEVERRSRPVVAP